MSGGDGGLRWLAWVLAGPSLWAVVFSAAYGLNGLGCALGWGGLRYGSVSLQTGVLGLVWITGLAGGLALMLRAPCRRGASSALPRFGLWIGLVATLFTLAPILVATRC